jgi:MSHA biogenesis protein MshN
VQKNVFLIKAMWADGRQRTGWPCALLALALFALALFTPPAYASAATSDLPMPAVTPPQEKADKAAPKARIDKRPKRVSEAQQADNLYRQAVAQLLQARGSDARQSLQTLLALDANHVQARQLLASLLVETRALDEAATVLREGLQRSPGESVFSLALARIEVETDATDTALHTLAAGLQAAGDDPHYHAFYAALLQRVQRHPEAVQHYLVALRSDPSMPTWLVGIGISLQALGQNRDAQEAFTRARDGGLLSPPLLSFVEQRLRQLP